MASVEPADVWNIASNLCSACLDGQYENCYCDDEEKLEKDLSCDSLDECSDTERDISHSKHKRNSIYDEYISDDEFQDTDVNRRLPPPTTDWDSIDSVLEKELDMKDNDIDETALSKRLSQNVNMQMVFVESEESDRGSDNDDNLELMGDMGYTDRRSTDSRGAECKRRTSSLEPVEESTRVLASLKLQQEHDEKLNGKIQLQRHKEAEFIDEIHQKNVDELRTMKDFLECHIAKLNFELLEQLEVRDYLYSHHETLVMDADDLTKSNENTEETTSNPINSISESSKPPSETTSSSTRTPTKRKRFWWR